jgi:hypothetical protein
MLKNSANMIFFSSIASSLKTASVEDVNVRVAETLNLIAKLQTNMFQHSPKHDQVVLAGHTLFSDDAIESTDLEIALEVHPGL